MMEFRSIGRVGEVELFDKPDDVPRLLRLVAPEPPNGVERFVHVDLTPLEAARLARAMRLCLIDAQFANTPADAMRVLCVVKSAEEAKALARFIDAWWRFET